MDKCSYCSKNISRKIEFGGVYYSLDGDPYCDKICYNKEHRKLAEVSKTEASLTKFIKGKS